LLTRLSAVVSSLGLVFGILGAGASASAEAPPALALSLPEAMNRAMADAPEVVSARQNVREADARRVGAGIVMPTNPRLAIDARPSVTQGRGFRDLGYGALLDIPFQPGGAPSARVHEAERAVTVARADLALDRSSARLRAFTAYVKSQVADLRIAEARSAMEISNRVLNAAQRRFAAGAASELEQASAELDVALLQASEIASVSERNAQLMDLRDALNLPPDIALALTSPVTEPPQLMDAARLVERAAKNHPQLAAIQARVTLLDATQARLEREVFPRVGLYTGIDAAPLSPVYGIIGLTVEIPVAQRNQGPLAMNARARETVITHLELEARRLAREVMAAYERYEARRLELSRLSDKAIPAAERSLSFAEAGWQAGRFDLFRLLTAARDALRVRATRIDVLEETWLARIELERAVGGEVGS
jgi:cobalt-zinc-cadmium efflux system outer membrane protein